MYQYPPIHHTTPIALSHHSNYTTPSASVAHVEEVAPGVITIGMIGKVCSLALCPDYVASLTGHPNVGKSSIINGIMGKKVSALLWLCCMFVVDTCYGFVAMALLLILAMALLLWLCC